MNPHNHPGRLIVIEGADGCGTTTQAEMLAEEINAYYTAEPTSTNLGKKVQDMISSNEYSPEAVAMAFAADRMAHVEEEILPKLKKGKTVVSDRYYHSSLVYQPVMGADLEWVREINKYPPRPDMTIVLDISADLGMDRVEDRGSDGHIFEELSFQEKVVKRYRELDDKLEENMKFIDGSQSKEQVFQRVKKCIKQA